ncbi:MAG: AAA family ATPase [Kiritimatiellae bacterium]|nr:AAA family ATPase [Kiritimatiellia bacterium]
MPKLIFTEGVFAGQEMDLPDAALVIGRGDEANLVIEDSEISSMHAELEPEGDAWRITDLDSSNGTALNGDMIESSPITDGDVITLGETVCTFRMDGEAVPEVEAKVDTTPAPAPPAEPAAPPVDASADEIALVEKMRDHADAIRAEVGKVIVGQIEVLDQILMCILAHGHALLIGLPGMAKTLTVSTIAKVLNLEFKRIQFTPDLMPTDITGTEVLESNRDTGEKEFRFVKGPIFCNLLLADEINRTPPKTQAALLEAMQEKMVTVGNESYRLAAPFFVLATQNPIEQEGTYPLPEAQLDRFMFNIWVDYPEAHEEEEIVGSTTAGTVQTPECVITQEDVLKLQEVVRKVPVSAHVIKYAIRLVRATRPQYDDAPEVTKNFVSTGAGPRAGQYLVLAAKARAVLEGRIHVGCSDIRAAAPPVLRHRILTNFAADSEGKGSIDIVNQLLEEIPEPGPEAYA